VSRNSGSKPASSHSAIARRHDRSCDSRGWHGSKGSTVFRDPNEDNRVWVLFDWDGEGWRSFVSDPDVPALLQMAGHVGQPQAAELVGHYDA
jgi:hypothetical protein